jgi:1-acylglycerone phosphate reductase
MMRSKSVLITGCSAGGIGNAFALTFQKRGFVVFATAPSIKNMQNLAALPKMHLLELDVTNPLNVVKAVQYVKETTDGTLDYLVNNAGKHFIMPALDVNIDVAKEIFEVNLWAPLRMIQHFEGMLIAAKGCAVNITSTAALLPLPLQSKVEQ